MTESSLSNDRAEFNLTEQDWSIISAGLLVLNDLTHNILLTRIYLSMAADSEAMKKVLSVTFPNVEAVKRIAELGEAIAEYWLLRSGEGTNE